MNKLEIAKNINEKICNLNKNELKEVFILINNTKTLFTRNSNGIFINLIKLNDNILYKIKDYIDFCTNSHSENHKHEILKNTISKNISNKTDLLEEDIDIDIDININIKKTEEKTEEKNEETTEETSDVIIEDPVSIKKINSNMKFYLAKKKLDFKGKNNKYILDDILTKDDYII